MANIKIERNKDKFDLYGGMMESVYYSDIVRAKFFGINIASNQNYIKFNNGGFPVSQKTRQTLKVQDDQNS